MTTIIGIDCATEAKKIGLALGECSTTGVVKLCKAETGAGSLDDVAAVVAAWILAANTQEKVLLALDAPMGWPENLSAALREHTAGQCLSKEANAMFSRETDHMIYDKVGKKPLDVGADRIARTAYAALSLLQKIRDLIGRPVPLVWNQQFAGCGTIEVYPAATLRQHGFPCEGYKDNGCLIERRTILAHLTPVIIDIQACTAILEKDADVLDAVVCVLAGADFMASRVISPDAPLSETVKREGWIWVYKPANTSRVQ